MNSQERLWSHCKSGPQPSSCVATLNAGKSHCGSLVLLLLYFSMASKELYEVLYFEQSLSIYHPSVSACCAVHQRKLRCPGLGRGNMLEQEKKKKVSGQENRISGLGGELTSSWTMSTSWPRDHPSEGSFTLSMLKRFQDSFLFLQGFPPCMWLLLCYMSTSLPS